MKRIAFTLMAIVLVAYPMFSQVISVPADQPSIQAGIDAATVGDTVLVADSTYYENINFNGKAITLASWFIVDGDSSHISKTIIDGSQSGNPDTASVVSMWSGEDTTSVLMGFTIRGGGGTFQVFDSYRDYCGGGILIEKSGGKIVSNIIEENHVMQTSNVPYFFGGGIGGDVFGGHTLIIRNNRIRKNSVDGNWVYGAGICLTGGRIIIEGNAITDNALIGRDEEGGGGIFWGSYGFEGTIEEVIIRNNLIDSNKGSIEKDWVGGGGIYIGSISQTVQTVLQIYNNVISNNSVGGMGGGIFNWASSMAIINNTIINNRAGMGGNTFHLRSGEMLLLNNILYSDVNNGKSEYQYSQDRDFSIWLYHNVMNSPIPSSHLADSRANIYAEPSFLDESYELAHNSPGVGHGVKSIELQGDWIEAPGWDFYGNTRPHPIDSRVDIGALESGYEGYVYVPDSAFLSALLDEGVDTNEDGIISYAEAEAVSYLNVSEKGITDMSGLHAFINLDTLNCKNNKLGSLDISNNLNLIKLDCAGNLLGSLNIMINTDLKDLIISDMSTLIDVCVWSLPFPPEGVRVETENSPNVSFNKDCIIPLSRAKITDKFIDYSLDNATHQLKARLFVPENYRVGKSYPVVVTLHGLGECGTDNKIHVLYNHIATSWGQAEFQAENPCFIFSPQCPTGKIWASDKVYQGVEHLLDSLISTYNIDTNRIYITGLSMGGMGTWDYLGIDPDRYAAALPVCGALYGAAYPEYIPKIKHIPIWNFHGNKDNVVNTEYSRSIFKRYPDYGEYPLYTHHYYRQEFNLDENTLLEYINEHTELLYSEVPDVGHDVWNVAYKMPLVKKWLFQQRKHARENIIVANESNQIKASGEHQFAFTVSDLTKSVSIWLGHDHSADWEYVDTVSISSGNYTFDSNLIEDHPLAILKFLAHDSSGHVIGKDYTDIFRIDNEGNGRPYIRLVDDYFINNTSIRKDKYLMSVELKDPESDPLHVTFWVSYDKGETFEIYSDTDTEEGIFNQVISLHELRYTNTMVLKVEVSDGEHTEAVQTLDFINAKGFQVSIESSSTEKLKVFPNPTNELITINLEHHGDYFIEINALNGQLLYEAKMEGNTHQVDLSPFPKGAYFITIGSKDFVATRKIIKL